MKKCPFCGSELDHSAYKALDHIQDCASNRNLVRLTIKFDTENISEEIVLQGKSTGHVKGKFHSWLEFIKANHELSS